jgi:hypothetical protein
MTPDLIVPGLPGYRSTADAIADFRAFYFPGTDGYQVPNKVALMAVDGAILANAGTVLASKAGVLAITLPAPVATSQDGVVLTVTATTAQANTVTCPSGSGIIEGTGNILTFGGAIGDYVVLIALAGKWYIKHKVNVTLSGT